MPRIAIAVAIFLLLGCTQSFARGGGLENAQEAVEEKVQAFEQSGQERQAANSDSSLISWDSSRQDAEAQSGIGGGSGDQGSGSGYGNY